MLPLPFLLLPSARLAPRLAERFGTNRVDAAGLLSIAAGLALVSRLGVELNQVTLYAGLALFAIGMGMAGTPATTAITASLPEAKQGVASAVNDLSREFGSALGIAVLGSLLTTSYRGSLAPALVGLPAQVAEGARSSIAFVTSDAVGRLGPLGQQLAAAGRQAYVDGVSAAVLTGAGVLVVAAIVVFFRAPKASDEHARGPGRGPAGRWRVAGGPAVLDGHVDIDLGQAVELGLAHGAGSGEHPPLLGADPLVDHAQQPVRQRAGLPDRDVVRQRLPQPGDRDPGRRAVGVAGHADREPLPRVDRRVGVVVAHPQQQPVPVLERALQLGVLDVLDGEPDPARPRREAARVRQQGGRPQRLGDQLVRRRHGHQPLAAAEHGLQLFERRGKVGQREAAGVPSCRTLDGPASSAASPGSVGPGGSVGPVT